MTEKKKPLLLPAIGKPKTKTKKLEVKSLGAKASAEYKKGAKEVVKLTSGPKKGTEMSERNFGKYRALWIGNDPAIYDDTYAGPGKKPKKADPIYYRTREVLARQTGMAKGGLISIKQTKAGKK